MFLSDIEKRGDEATSQNFFRVPSNGHVKQVLTKNGSVNASLNIHLHFTHNTLETRQPFQLACSHSVRKLFFFFATFYSLIITPPNKVIYRSFLKSKQKCSRNGESLSRMKSLKMAHSAT